MKVKKIKWIYIKKKKKATSTLTSKNGKLTISFLIDFDYTSKKFLVYIVLALYDSHCKLNKYVQYWTHLFSL